MKRYVLGILAAVIYIIMVVLLIAVCVLFKDNNDMMQLGLYALSSTLMLITIIFACLLYRNNASEKYQEMYLNDEREDSGKKE